MSRPVSLHGGGSGQRSKGGGDLESLLELRVVLALEVQRAARLRVLPWEPVLPSVPGTHSSSTSTEDSSNVSTSQIAWGW
eukprot:409583-Rhodomonas_salina.1